MEPSASASASISSIPSPSHSPKKRQREEIEEEEEEEKEKNQNLSEESKSSPTFRYKRKMLFQTFFAQEEETETNSSREEEEETAQFSASIDSNFDSKSDSNLNSNTNSITLSYVESSDMILSPTDGGGILLPEYSHNRQQLVELSMFKLHNHTGSGDGESLRKSVLIVNTLRNLQQDDDSGTGDEVDSSSSGSNGNSPPDDDSQDEISDESGIHLQHNPLWYQQKQQQIEWSSKSCEDDAEVDEDFEFNYDLDFTEADFADQYSAIIHQTQLPAPKAKDERQSIPNVIPEYISDDGLGLGPEPEPEQGSEHGHGPCVSAGVFSLSFGEQINLPPVVQIASPRQIPNGGLVGVVGGGLVGVVEGGVEGGGGEGILSSTEANCLHPPFDDYSTFLGCCPESVEY